MNVGDKRTYAGLVEINPYGNWSDVDHGLYIGGERFADEHCDLAVLVGKHVAITVEVLPSPEPEARDDE